jgi:hypothetical protein
VNRTLNPVLTLLRILLTLAWAAWFGGMLALLVFVTRLFKASREIGVTGAPVLFRTFVTYQLIVGSLTLVLAVALALVSRSKAVAIAGVFSLISLALVFPIRGWTNRIGELYAAGQSNTEEFKGIHRMSSATYSTSALLLACAGIAIAAHRPKPKLPV